MSFVAGALTNPVDRTVIRAIVQMAAELGITAIAEGVEGVEQQNLLVGLGAGAAQGYLFARPMPRAHLAIWLETNAQASREKAAGNVVTLRPRTTA